MDLNGIKNIRKKHERLNKKDSIQRNNLQTIQRLSPPNPCRSRTPSKAHYGVGAQRATEDNG